MSRYLLWRLPVVLSLLLLGSYTTQTIGEEENKKEEETTTEVSELKIGSKAPALDVEHWVQDGNGKYKPVTEFQPGQVYVVEFWATWCGPCRQSMPHLAETQEKYEKQVQIVSISDEKLETVEEFLKQKLPEDQTKTYADLTSAYCLTTDPDKSNHTSYMEAAKQNGIPTAFIVGKDGHVEWIGHPMTMDEALKAVVEDQWDRDAFLEFQSKLAEIQGALQKGQTKEALTLIDEALSNSPKMFANQLNRGKFFIMLQTGEEGTAEQLRVLSADMEDSTALNELAWTVYQISARAKVSDDTLAVAVELAEKAVGSSQGQQQGYALDTLAHLKQKQGNLDEAIELQTKAVELAPEQQLKDYLEELNKEKDKGTDKDKDGDSEEDQDKEKEKEKEDK